MSDSNSGSLFTAIKQKAKFHFLKNHGITESNILYKYMFPPPFQNPALNCGASASTYDIDTAAMLI
jgi:hypothetical protein